MNVMKNGDENEQVETVFNYNEKRTFFSRREDCEIRVLFFSQKKNQIFFFFFIVYVCMYVCILLEKEPYLDTYVSICID